MSFIKESMFHIHLIMAISWIGGSVFMFVLGVSLRDKKAQQEVYPHIGPIFGWFEVVALVALLISGFYLGGYYKLFPLLMHPNGTVISHTIRIKALLVLILTVATIIHFIIAYKTNGMKRTKLQNLLSRGSSMLIFFLNLFVMHYAIILRDIL